MIVQEVSIAPYFDHALQLRVRFSTGEVGYSELCSWTELGNPTLDEEVRALIARNPLKSGQHALELAWVDAQARQRGVSLFTDLKIPESHALIQNFVSLDPLLQFEEEGFRRVKIKLKPNQGVALLKRAIQETDLLFRLDFNARFSKEEWNQFLAEDHDWSRIEMIEDPTRDSADWVQGRVPVAQDFVEADQKHYQIEVIKPGRDGLAFQPKGLCSITSLLATPLGDAMAAYFAGILFKNFPTFVLPSGFLCYRRLVEDPFTERLSQRGPQFTTPGGTGWGFDDLLGGMEWQKIL